MEISADEIGYDRKNDSVEAKGNVRVTSRNTVMEADSMIYLEGERRAMAKGNVIIREDGDTITADSLDYSFEDATGSIINGEIFLKKGNYRIRGERINKLGEKKYSVRGGTFTTCDGDSPGWTVKASEVKVEIDGYLFADHARLYVKNIPVFYTPKFIVPVKTERETGLLSPKIGYSDSRGFLYKQPLFWAISRSKDATISLNHEGDKGTGGDLEYRYSRRRYSSGDMEFRYMNQKSPAPENRWKGDMKHREDFAPGLHGRLDLHTVSDRGFFLDYEDNVDQYSLQYLESEASIVKNWQDYSLLVKFSYLKNLTGIDDAATQRLPEATLATRKARILESPFFFQFDSKLVNFWRKETDETAGVYAGQRLDLYPSLSLPINPGNIFELTPKLGLRETFYRTEGKEAKWDSRGIYDFNVDFIIPAGRVYDLDMKEIKRLKHIIEPGFEYYYTPDVDQSGLPAYDSLDRIEKNKLLRLKLNNYIVTKRITDGVDRYNRLASLKIYRDYDFHEAERPLASPSDQRRPWGPITGQLRVTAERGFTLNTEVRYDTYDNKTADLSSDFEGKNGRGHMLRISYRYSLPDVRYLDSMARLPITDSLKVAYYSRYSLEDSLALENKYGMMFTHQCWSMEVTYSEREVPREDKFYIVISLKGLGDTGNSGGLF